MEKPVKPSKLQVFTALLEKGSVFVHFTALLDEGLLIPNHLQGKDQVVFQFGWNLPIPILDFAYNEFKVSGYLSFKGKPSYVNVPWDAVFALVGEDAKGVVWDDEIPEAILNPPTNVVPIRGAMTKLGSIAPKVKSKPGADRSHLSLVR